MADSQKKSYNLAHDILIQKNDTSQYWSVLFFDADLEPDTTYTLSIESTSTTFRFYTNGSLFTEEVYFNTENGRKSVTVRTKSTISKSNAGQATNGRWIILKNAINQPSTIQISNIMLNVGSTAKPYEPYGWLHSLRKLGTATDTITTLPAVLYPTGSTATVGLKGNTVQSGTPTPDNPIMPQGTGDMTGNLFDAMKVEKGRIDSSTGIIGYAEDTTNLTYSETNNEFTITTRYAWRGFVTDYIDLQEKPAFSYISDDGIFDSFTYAYDANKTFLGAIISNVPTGTKYIRVSIQCETVVTNAKIKNIMLGSSLTYEPYGYKIPISSANTTTPVYLGEVESTRRIKKLVLDGTENWQPINSGFAYLDTITDYSKVNGSISICTHFKTNDSVTSAGDAIDGVTFYNAPPENYRLYIKDSTLFTTITTLKSWLADQYAAGTPVTVWYVLATPTTGIVNEPLRKIGDYADTVSGITIPTITGKDTFDVLTTLKPSEVELTYTGWHDASVKEWDGTQWS